MTPSAGINWLDLLRPFDQAQVTTVEILLVTEIERLLDPIDPVEVEMINRDGDRGLCTR